MITKDHILMFAKAKEIQENWKPEVGDRFSYRHPDYHDKTFTLTSQEQIDCNREIIIGLLSIEQMAKMWCKAKKEELKSEGDKPSYTFLYSLLDFHEGYFFGGKHNYRMDYEIESLPIIVLAFLMDSLYGLKWSEEGKGWV